MFEISEQEIRELRAADPARGWAAIPDECPPEFVTKIVEERARRIGRGHPTVCEPVVPQADIAALRDRLSAAAL